MSLPGNAVTLTLDYSVSGGPGINVAAKTGVTLGGLNYSTDGGPFYGAYALVPITNNPLPSSCG